MRKPLKPLAYSRPPLNVFGRQLYNGVVNLKYLDENKEEVEVNVTLVKFDPEAYKPDPSDDKNFYQVWDVDAKRWIEFDWRNLTEYNGRVDDAKRS
jgi:hypothetical protein